MPAAHGVGFDEAERLLREGTFEDCRPLWYSGNYVFLAQMLGPSGESFAGVYKPRRGETPLWDFPDGTLYQREVAAYQLSRILGWDFIPPTVVRDGPQGIGSIQLFISHDQTSHFFEQRETPELIPQLQRIAAFDYVSNNADRKGGHCLLDEDGRIWGIDHGLCFHEQYKMRTVIWDWAEQPIPGEWIAALCTLSQELAEGSERLATFAALIDERELAAMAGRIEKLIDQPMFPTPGPHRSYPWPLV